jgi:hypothetical protein
MRKRSTLRTRFVALPYFLVATVLGAQAARGSETPLPASSELSNESVDRARGNVARIQTLVGEGSLPKSSLDEAESRLADINDEATLKETLYSSTKLADLTAEQQASMLDAAQRRVDRQAAIVGERQRLLVMGVIAKAEMRSVNTELETRRHVLDLAYDRVRLVETQRQMAQEEQSLERALESGTSRKAMLKFDGSGHFDKNDLDVIGGEFEQQFHYPLPVTARGQTALHQSLGLDHRGKVDVGLNPEEPEGIWLRHFLEDRQIPYIAFRAAVRGSATAPHIHLGTGSSRIVRLAQR